MDRIDAMLSATTRTGSSRSCVSLAQTRMLPLHSRRITSAQSTQWRQHENQVSQSSNLHPRPHPRVGREGGVPRLGDRAEKNTTRTVRCVSGLLHCQSKCPFMWQNGFGIVVRSPALCLRFLHHERVKTTVHSEKGSPTV